MHPLIDSRRQEIAELARHFGVRRLDVFGSILRADFDESSSDIDIVVEFEPNTGESSFRQYFDLKSKLEALFGRPIDLVELGAMGNTRLERIIERSKIPVYTAPTSFGAASIYITGWPKMSTEGGFNAAEGVLELRI
jgi:predicted nucleotidyltransferase